MSKSETVGYKSDRVLVCICTSGRGGGLHRLLSSIPAAAEEVDVDVGILVVDNSGLPGPPMDKSALEQAAERPIILACEPRVGIPYARNLACERAMASCEVMIFVDDDEEVSAHWLSSHLWALEAFDADVTVGPVVPILPDAAPSWAKGGALHGIRQRRTGDEMPTAPSGNTAVRTSVLARVTPWFDASLAGTGGSDSEYFKRVAASGCRIVWVEEATAYEHVPIERARVAWVMRRAYRVGAVDTVIARAHTRTLAATVAVRSAKGAQHVAVGALRAVLGIASRRRALAGLRQVFEGLGALGGLVGLRPRRYH